jgi:hypothetical protein
LGDNNSVPVHEGLQIKPVNWPVADFSWYLFRVPKIVKTKKPSAGTGWLGELFSK